ncbi:hypothetical protein PBI_THONKO_98 [Mycobacterium phage Thonko]|uniref:Uncharacterized protein n=1 Tax=Mycobacterium phage Thonko TaxID=2282910 RepID=A0A346FCE3_9CAUD|nr:hypothetical protein I5G57_gp098 [Mycobacterium phage Thonko]AXN53368.1 hypothetical protein PBI_THONKO_98 [Mycobacterium phage Thonko]
MTVARIPVLRWKPEGSLTHFTAALDDENQLVLTYRPSEPHDYRWQLRIRGLGTDALGVLIVSEPTRELAQRRADEYIGAA